MAIQNSNITYIFLEKTIVQKFAKSSKNVSEVISQSPVTLREADYKIFADEEGNQFGIISFVAPKATLQLMQKNMNEQSVEDF